VVYLSEPVILKMEVLKFIRTVLYFYADWMPPVTLNQTLRHHCVCDATLKNSCIRDVVFYLYLFFIYICFISHVTVFHKDEESQV